MKNPKRLAMTGDCQRAAALQAACEVFAKLAYANLLSFHIVYSMYALADRLYRDVTGFFRTPIPSISTSTTSPADIAFVFPGVPV